MLSKGVLGSSPGILTEVVSGELGRLPEEGAELGERYELLRCECGEEGSTSERA